MLMVVLRIVTLSLVLCRTSMAINCSFQQISKLSQVWRLGSVLHAWLSGMLLCCAAQQMGMEVGGGIT